MNGLHPIPGFSAYYAKADGSIWSTRPFGKKTVHTSNLSISQAHRLTAGLNSNKDYLQVRVWKNGKPITRTVHILVALAFHGLRPKNKVCRHINGNGLDNRANNLRWGTVRQNIEDVFRTNGGVFNSASLTADDVRLVRNSPATEKTLSDYLGVHPHTILRIRRGVTYRRVA